MAACLALSLNSVNIDHGSDLACAAVYNTKEKLKKKIQLEKPHWSYKAMSSVEDKNSW